MHAASETWVALEGWERWCCMTERTKRLERVKMASPTSRAFCTFYHPRVAKLGFGVVYVSYVLYVLYVINLKRRKCF